MGSMLSRMTSCLSALPYGRTVFGPLHTAKAPDRDLFLSRLGDTWAGPDGDRRGEAQWRAPS
jgi:hypothetical protein